MPLVATALAFLVAAIAAPSARAISWARPVRGAVTRGFDVHGSPYARGQHRGADFAAVPGAPVRAPCDGRVAVATRIGSSGGVVTVACGQWRASVLPLGRITARVGARVAAGEPVGAAGTSRLHAGVHLGVRRAGRRFGYVDPLRFLRRARRPPLAPLAPRAARGRRGPVASHHPGPVAPPHHGFVAPRHPALVAGPHHGFVAAPRPALVAPWPAWLGAALLLAGAGAGAGGAIVRRRRRTASLAVARARTRASPRGAG